MNKQKQAISPVRDDLFIEKDLPTSNSPVRDVIIKKWQIQKARRLWGFSYSHSHIGSVVKYILNQEQHHKKKSFKEEYLEILNKFEIDYDGRYVLKLIPASPVRQVSSLTGLDLSTVFFCSINIMSLAGHPIK